MILIKVMIMIRKRALAVNYPTNYAAAWLVQSDAGFPLSR